MISGGISVEGTYHKENQDYYYSGEFNNGFVLVVSDGLGSKENSGVGSKALCDSVVSVLNSNDGFEDYSIKEYLIPRIHQEWIDRLRNYDISTCYATLLTCIVMPKKVIAIRLGDGFLGIKIQNKVQVLFDKKEHYFVNQTDCMTAELELKLWDIVEISDGTFEGAIACTDGIGIEPPTVEGYKSFTSEFIQGYKGEERTSIINDIKQWIVNWTGSDDKTLAFLLKKVR